MANGLIGKVTAGGGTHLIASTAYFTCATAAATAAKEAKAADTNLNSITLMTGLTIYVKFTNYNSVANPTLTLQTNGGTELLAAKPIMRYGTTTAYQNSAGSWRSGAMVAFTYDGTNWVEHSSIDDNSNDTGYYVRHIYTNIKAGSVGIFPYTIIMQRNDGRWDSIVTSSSTDTSKACNTNGFVLGQVMLMYANKTYAADANVDTYNVWQMHSGLIDHRYSFNTANNATSGTAARKPVYLVGTITNGLFYLDTTKWWATALPTSADGKVYIYIGESYDYYRLTFAGYHPIYHYTNGALRLYGGDASTVNGQVLGTLATKSSIANHSYTPAGSVNISTNTAVNTTTVNSITAVGTLPSLTVTATDVVTGGTTTAIPNISKKTVVTGVTKKTVVTSATFNNVVTSAVVTNEILTISTGAAGSAATGDSVTVTTGDSVTVGTAINAYTALTTSSIGSASGWSAGTLPTKGSNTTVATGIKTQPAFTFSGTTATLTHSVS